MKIDIGLILERVQELVGKDVTAYKQEIDNAANSDEAWSMLVLEEIVACKHTAVAILTILGKLELPD